METQFFYDIASWPMDNIVDLQMGTYDEVGLVPFIASDFPSTAEIGLNYSWSREQLNWTNEYPIKSDASQPYPQSWYEAGLVRQDHEWINDNPTSLSLDQSHQPTSFQTTENTPTSARADLKLATQRALFMTPSPNALAFPSPGSPASDPRASPGSSRASSSGWEGEAEREDAQFSNFDFGASTFDTPYQASVNYQIDSPYHGYCKTEDDECFTPLEMPDGTTRLTSNWLPVNQDAGLTIGCPTVLEDDATAFHSSIMLDDDTAAFQSMKHAFFPSDPAAWWYDR